MEQCHTNQTYNGGTLSLKSAFFDSITGKVQHMLESQEQLSYILLAIDTQSNTSFTCLVRFL